MSRRLRQTDIHRHACMCMVTTVRGVAVLFLGVALLSGCGGKDATTDDAKSKATSTASAGPVEPARYGSVTELRDAAIEVGYVCENWVGDNRVNLAAESGTCDDESVLATYASDADLQAQLDTDKELTGLMTENGIESTPVLVGPNWIFKAPEAPAVREKLGGVIVGARLE